LLSVETRTLPMPDYMASQSQLTWKMRKTLALWIVQVTMEFSLEQDTLFLAINLVDRICSKRSILSQQYQLLGLTCLWMAAKVHENHGSVPSIRKLIYMCCHVYSRENFIAMERFVLVELGFYLQHVSPNELLSTYSEVYKLDTTTVFLAKYLIELAIVHKRFIGVRPSFVARAAMQVAANFIDGQNILGDSATEQDLICQDHLHDCLRNQPQILIKKFGCKEFQFVSRIVEGFDTCTGVSNHSSHLQQQPSRPPTFVTPNALLQNGLLTPPQNKDTFSGEYALQAQSTHQPQKHFFSFSGHNYNPTMPSRW